VTILTFEDFSPHIDSSFAVDLGECRMGLTLTEAEKQPVHPYPGMAREPFSLTFCSDTQTVLPQQIYTLSHPSMGDVEIFLVPIGRDPAGVRYQAVYN
jgi:hypothetical protein